MILRKTTVEDVPVIEAIAQRYEFPLPEKFESSAVAVNGSVKAFGVLRNNIEAILVCDGTVREKSQALNLLMNEAIKQTQLAGNNELYVYAQDEQFAQVLEKHFNFRRCKYIPMILEF